MPSEPELLSAALIAFLEDVGRLPSFESFGAPVVRVADLSMLAEKHLDAARAVSLDLTGALDVERLARAIHSEFSGMAWCEPDWSECDQRIDWTTGAESVAREYAAIKEQSHE